MNFPLINPVIVARMRGRFAPLLLIRLLRKWTAPDGLLSINNPSPRKKHKKSYSAEALVRGHASSG
jgi:hypothetical protein